LIGCERPDALIKAPDKVSRLLSSGLAGERPMTLTVSPNSKSDRNRRDTARKRILSSNMATASALVP
jgi:hypothetical protein